MKKMLVCLLAATLSFLLFAPVSCVFAEGDEGEITQRKITGYYYDPNKGKLVPKYDNLSPAASVEYREELLKTTHKATAKATVSEVARIKKLTYRDFATVSPAFVKHLSVEQIRSIPNNKWFKTLSEEQRAALSDTQVQALNTAKLDIGLLTPEQREWLTVPQIHNLKIDKLPYVPLSRVEDISTDQLAKIQNTKQLSRLSIAQRELLGVEQIQALDTGKVRISALPLAQRDYLSLGQIASLQNKDFRYLPESRIPDLAPEQVASIPNTKAFKKLSEAQRAALTPRQVQALDTEKVRIYALSDQQREYLTLEQVNKVNKADFRHLPVSKISQLTPEQVGSIPNTNQFKKLSAAQRAAFTPEQVQAVDTQKVRISALSPEQRVHLSEPQVKKILRTVDYSRLPVSHVGYLEPDQIAAIPSKNIFNRFSAEQVAQLQKKQVKAISDSYYDKIKNRLTDQQRSWRKESDE